jgi:hypothetical protein
MLSAASDVQWGDVATWVGGIATAIALFLTYLLLRLTRREQRANRADLDLAQARLVSAWCDSVQPATGAERDLIIVTLQNSSHEPIYAARLAVGPEWSTEQTECAEPDLDVKDVVPPRQDSRHEVRLRLSRAPDGNYEPSPPVEILFRDASRRFWHRDRFGRLTQIKDDPPKPSSSYFFRAAAG